jgi:hypothetical protein
MALAVREADAEPPSSAPVVQNEPAVQSDDDAETQRARELFSTGAAFAKRMQWAEALSAFQEVARLHPHPVVTLNVGICERALGRYTRARATFARVLEASRSNEVAPSIVEEVLNYQRELDRLLVHVSFTLSPQPGIHLVVDGRPLTATDRGVFVAGLATEENDDRVQEGTFELVIDPGAHIFHAAREGYTDVVLNRSFPPAFRGDLRVELERLPARVHVDSTVSPALVVVNGTVVGDTPVDVTWPAGSYQLEVRKPGFAPYQSTVLLEAGGHTDLTARLLPASRPITSQWWFWAGAVAIVATGALVTYAATRPTPDPPPYNGGGAGWVAVVK